MIGKQLWHWIENVANQSSTWTKIKIILMGDPAQLNPVNEGKSLSFQVANKAVLTQVVRQGIDSPLLEFVTASRYAVTKSKLPFAPFSKYLPDKSNGALMVKRQTLLRYACKKMSKEFVNNPDCFRQIYVLHEDEEKRFHQETKRLLKSAKRNPFLWKQYYKHLEQFANIRNCFALTVHNSQGSTFLEAGIDGQDLSKRLNRERGADSKAVLAKIKEFNRLYYVSSSRARQRILVIR
jgi:hypothetical protein